MNITAQEFIKEMGVGYNLGNTYECYKEPTAIKYKNNYEYKIECVINDESTILVDYTAFDTSVESISISTTLPEIIENSNIKMKLTFRNTKVVESSEELKVNISGFTVGDNTIDSCIKEYTMPSFSDSISDVILIESDDTIFTSNSTLSITASISYFPTSTTHEAKLYMASMTQTSWGTPKLTKYQLEAVKSIGFKTIRLPITWYGHFNSVTYDVDTEYLDLIGEFVKYITEDLDMYCIINMHHDDADSNWLTTDGYLTDTEMQNKYKTIWKCIATYFASYNEKLIFESNNETRAISHSWDTSNSDALYGITVLQKDFYDVVRSISGNEKRLLMFPCYAAKYGHLSRTFTDSDGNKKTYHLPNEEDEYCFVDVHIYETGLATIRNAVTYLSQRDYPIVIGEFGINKSIISNETMIRSQQYFVAYARFKGIGTCIWDDYGTMGILKRTKCTSSEKAKDANVWEGAMLNYVPNLINSSVLKDKISTTSTRLNEFIVGDEFKIYLNTENQDKVIVSSENGITNISENLVSCPLFGTEQVLLIGENGDYSVHDITINKPTHLKKNTIELNKDNCIRGYNYNTYDNNKLPVYNGSMEKRFIWEVIKVNPGSNFNLKISIKHTNSKTGNFELYPVSLMSIYIIEYKNDSGAFVSTASESITENKNNEMNSWYLSKDTNYIGIGVQLTSNSGSCSVVTFDDLEIIVDCYITERDYEYDDYPLESRQIKLNNINNFGTFILRDVDIIGGLSYRVNIPESMKIFVQEIKNNNIISNQFYENNDSIDTEVFSDKLRIYLIPKYNISYRELLTLCENASEIISLTYEDYTVLPDTGLKEDKYTYTNKNFISLNNKFVVKDGKVLNIQII